MKEMQFSIVVLTTLMCSALILLLPERVRRDKVINQSRWLMVGALGLIGAQFLVQYITQLRAIGVTQAVLVNLAFFVPASGLMSLTVLNLQRQGRLSKAERWVWLAVSLLVIGVLTVAIGTDGHPLALLSDRVRWVEIVLGMVSATMQSYYSLMQFRELERMQDAIENYFDRERRGLIMWMKHSIAVTGLLAVVVPIFIFGPNVLLVIYALLFFWGIFLMWFCFVRYFTSNDMKRVLEAQENAREEQQETAESDEQGGSLSPATMESVTHAVERWMATGAHLKAGITSAVAADSMGIPRYQLSAWVKASGHKSFSRWITSLRIDEAKHILQNHSAWNNETIADHCGVSRAYFHRIFKRETGLAPSDYVARGDVGISKEEA